LIRLLAAVTLALVVASSTGSAKAAEGLATPAPGDACAAFAPELASRVGVAISSVSLDTKWSSKPPWVYQAPAKGGTLEFDFDVCAPKPAWTTIRYLWIKRSVPIELVLASGPIRSIGARMEGSKPMVVAVDRQGRTTKTVFKEYPFELYIGSYQGRLSAGFGVPHSDYCADIVESKSGPAVNWCGA
jgi:hypothetical protein